MALKLHNHNTRVATKAGDGKCSHGRAQEEGLCSGRQSCGADGTVTMSQAARSTACFAHYPGPRPWEEAWGQCSGPTAPRRKPVREGKKVPKVTKLEEGSGT